MHSSNITFIIIGSSCLVHEASGADVRRGLHQVRLWESSLFYNHRYRPRRLGPLRVAETRRRDDERNSELTCKHARALNTSPIFCAYIPSRSLCSVQQEVSSIPFTLQCRLSDCSPATGSGSQANILNAPPPTYGLLLDLHKHLLSYTHTILIG